MNALKFFGATLVLSAFLFPALAYDSTIADKEDGNAADIVETDNVIHVYRYLGDSSESVFGSTFDEGEAWDNGSWLPVYKVKPAPKVEREPITVTFPYVQMVDDCRESGMVWDYRTDTCR